MADEGGGAIQTHHGREVAVPVLDGVLDDAVLEDGAPAVVAALREGGIGAGVAEVEVAPVTLPTAPDRGNSTGFAS